MSYAFDGVNDVLVKLGAIGAITSNTVSYVLWMYQNGSNNQTTANLFATSSINHLNLHRFHVRQPGQHLRFFDRTTGVDIEWRTADATVKTAQWVHVAVTWDGTAIANTPTFYIDGATALSINQGGNATGTTQFAQGSSYSIGASTNAQFPFPGVIAHVDAFTRVLSQAEIRQLMYVPHSIEFGRQLSLPLLYDAGSAGDWGPRLFNAAVTSGAAAVISSSPPVVSMGLVPMLACQGVY